ALRSTIPESVVGTVSGSSYDTFGLALEHRLGSQTYLSVQGNFLRSANQRDEGALGSFAGENYAVTRRLEFFEKTLSVSVSQLLGDYWSIGCEYRLSQAHLENLILEQPVNADSDLDATLHQVRLLAVLNLPTGFFAQADSLWNAQNNRGYSTP